MQYLCNCVHNHEYKYKYPNSNNHVLLGVICIAQSHQPILVFPFTKYKYKQKTQ